MEHTHNIQKSQNFNMIIQPEPVEITTSSCHKKTQKQSQRLSPDNKLMLPLASNKN